MKAKCKLRKRQLNQTQSLTLRMILIQTKNFNQNSPIQVSLKSKNQMIKVNPKTMMKNLKRK